MGTKRIGQENTRSLTQNNHGAYAITLPIEQIRELGWRKNQKVVVRRQGKRLIVEDWKP